MTPITPKKLNMLQINNVGINYNYRGDVSTIKIILHNETDKFSVQSYLRFDSHMIWKGFYFAQQNCL